MDTSINQDGLNVIPPALTFSAQSPVHFPTSTALRDNKPADGSSALTCPRDPCRARCRRLSAAAITSTDDGTVSDHSPVISRPYPATSNTTTTTRSVVETLNSLAPTHIGSISGIGKSERWMRDHREPVRKVRSEAQGSTEAKGDDEGIIKVWDDPQLLSKLRGGHFGSSPFILKSRESGKSKGD